MTEPDARPDEAEVDPADFLRALLAISPEDAETARDRAVAAMEAPGSQEGPSRDYGDSNGPEH